MKPLPSRLSVMDGKLEEVGERHTRTATFDLLLAKRMFFLKTHVVVLTLQVDT